VTTGHLLAYAPPAYASDRFPARLPGTPSLEGGRCHSPFTPRHGLDGFLGKLALGLSIASNDPSNVVPRAKCRGVNEKIISRAVLELDDELAVSVCCHGTFLANLNRQCPARPGLFHAQTPSERRLDASDDYQVPHFTEVGSTKSAPPFETPRGGT